MEISLGKRIKTLRESFRIKQEELALTLKMDRVSLSLIENDKRSLKTNELLLLAKCFNMSIDALLDLQSKPETFLKPIKKPKEKKVKITQSNFQKFKEVLIYILNTVGAKPNVGETTLYKLLYFIDFNYYEKYKEQLIGATYIKTDNGPVPLEFQTIINELIESKEVEIVKSNYFLHPQKKYLSHRAPDLSALKATEIKLIDDVLHKFSDMSSDNLKEYALQDTPCSTTINQKKIKYELVFSRLNHKV